MQRMNVETVHALLNHAVDYYTNRDYQTSLKLIDQAIQAAQHLEPRDHSLEFRAFFYKMINHSMQQQWSLTFANGLQCVCMIENTQLEIETESKHVALCYFGCSDAALHLPSINQEAIRINRRGIAWCQLHAPEFLLFGQHLEAKLLINNQRFTAAALLAEQSLAQKELQPDAFGCAMSCYQAIYVEAMAWAGKKVEAIAYAERALAFSPNIEQLWFEKARIYFKNNDYLLTVNNCRQTLFVNEIHSYANILCAQSQILMQQPQQALTTLERAHANNPKDMLMTLWLFFLGGDKAILQRSFNPQSWLHTVCGFALGKVSLPQLLQQAKTQDDHQQCIGQSYCFAALQAQQRGLPQQARKHYQYCLKYSHFNSNEFFWAKACVKPS